MTSSAKINKKKIVCILNKLMNKTICCEPWCLSRFYRPFYAKNIQRLAKKPKKCSNLRRTDRPTDELTDRYGILKSRVARDLKRQN